MGKFKLGHYIRVARTYISFYHLTFLARKTYTFLGEPIGVFYVYKISAFMGVLGHAAWICQVGNFKKGLGIKILSLLGFGLYGKDFQSES